MCGKLTALNGTQTLRPPNLILLGRCVDRLLGERPTPASALSQVTGQLVQYDGDCWWGARLRHLLALLIDALLDRRPHAKLALMRRAATLAPLLCVSPDPSCRDKSSLFSKWMSMLRWQWSFTNRLPRQVLAQLGCAGANVTVVTMLSLGKDTPSVDSCRLDLARILGRDLGGKNLDVWYNAMAVRPMEPSRVNDHGTSHQAFLKTVLDRYVTDPAGLFLEFGVHKGASVNLIARKLRDLGGGWVYGFDSFRGLPEIFPTTFIAPVGCFQLNGLPHVEDNVELVVGWFNETLPKFLRRELQGPLRLLHLDADLWSSTWEVLSNLQPYITSGCLIVIDDFINFWNFHRHGFRALSNFLYATGMQLETLLAPWVLVGGQLFPYESYRPQFPVTLRGVDFGQATYAAFRVV